MNLALVFDINMDRKKYCHKISNTILYDKKVRQFTRWLPVRHGVQKPQHLGPALLALLFALGDALERLHRAA